MKAIRANRSNEPAAHSKSSTEIRPGASPAHVSHGFANYRVKVDADGREYFAVPLIGPKRKPGAPYLIAHFSLPPPRQREALLEELARIFARAAVDRLLAEK